MSSTTICITDMSVIPFPTLDSTCTPPSNTANGPLPHIPCRNARSNPLLSFSDLSISDSNTSHSTDSADYALQSRSATCVRYDSGSSSSSDSTPSDEARPTIVPRAKRVGLSPSIVTDSRDIFTAVTPASTPVRPNADGRSFAALESKKQTPPFDPSDDEDTLRPFPILRQAPFCKLSKLRLEGSTEKLPRPASDTDVAASRPSATTTSNPSSGPQTIRKKSGQPVKSSLKTARRPELHVVTSGSFAKSEPATPTHTKAVHFDSKLEHVKLFLAEQKPLAVSRDGSPTDDTSGEEFPSFIYGNGRRENQSVRMLLPNMPSSPRKEDNIALQELVLSQDQRMITGMVRVRNIAYEKWLAARFTLDLWQTTSEVTARYERSIEDGAFDIFMFAIRLHDIWSRIEEKTIFVALRYTVAGQEHWDNNAGRNYHIKFVLDPPSEPSSAVDSKTGLKDLNSRLEDLAKTRSASIPISPYRLGRSFSADHQYSSFTKSPGRYDFASAYKAQRVRNTSPPPSRHTRTQTYPAGVSVTAGPAAAPWSDTLKGHSTEQATPPLRSRPRPPPLSLGPLQEAMESAPTPPSRSDAHSASPSIPSPSPSRSPDGRERHHRRAYIDRVMEESPTLRRTPTGSPLKFGVTSKDTATVAQLPRTRSYPLTGEKPEPMAMASHQPTPKLPLSIRTAPASRGSSGEPTPYDASESSSSSTSCNTPLMSPPPPECSRSDVSYKQFIDQFCFYTGGDSLLQEPSIPRSHSASSVDRYMLSHSPPTFSSHMRDGPGRFAFDPNGSTTPSALRV